MRAENDKLSSEIQRHQSELKKLKKVRDANTEQEAEISRLKKTLQTVNNELQHNREQTKVKEKEIEKLEQQQRDSLGVKKNMDQQIASIKEENERLKGEKQSVMAEKTTLAEQVATMKSDSKEKEIELKSLRERIESTRSEQQKTEQRMGQQLKDKDQDIEALKGTLQQASDTITQRERENEEFRTQMVQYQEECKEYQLKIEKLNQEVKELKLETLDTTKYVEWDCGQILLWICSVDNKRYSRYEAKLQHALEEAEVEGDDLPQVNETDLKNWGIQKFKDQKGLIRQIQQLVRPKDVAKIPNAESYQPAPSEGGSTAFI